MQRHPQTLADFRPSTTSILAGCVVLSFLAPRFETGCVVWVVSFRFGLRSLAERNRLCCFGRFLHRGSKQTADS